MKGGQVNDGAGDVLDPEMGHLNDGTKPGPKR